MNRIAQTLALAIPLTTFTLTALAEPAFYLMGNVGAGTYSNVTSLSHDGTVACGTHTGPLGGSFTWTPSGGRMDVEQPAFFEGISSDGTVVTGSRVNPASGKLEMIRQSVNGTPEYFGVPSGFDLTLGTAVNATHDTIVGYAQRNANGLQSPVRWTATSGLQRITGPDLGNVTQAWDVSADGKTVVGDADDTGTGVPLGWVWREGVGESRLFECGSARGVTPDGRIIVGTGKQGAGMWIDGVPQYLGIVAGWDAAEAMDVSDDGNVVIGKLRRNAFDQDSFVWTPGTGMMMAKDYFLANGVPLPSDLLAIDIDVVSGDGLSFGGKTGNRTFASGFVATVPAPHVILCLGSMGVLSMIRRRR